MPPYVLRFVTYKRQLTQLSKFYLTLHTLIKRLFVPIIPEYSILLAKL